MALLRCLFRNVNGLSQAFRHQSFDHLAGVEKDRSFALFPFLRDSEHLIATDLARAEYWFRAVFSHRPVGNWGLVVVRSGRGRCHSRDLHFLCRREREIRVVTLDPVDVPLEPRQVDHIAVVVVGNVALVGIDEGLDLSVPLGIVRAPMDDGDLELGAHEVGVVHRDFKSDNVFLVPSEGGERVVVTDFGLEKLTSDDSNLTLDDQILGRPNYMAPEQTRAGSEVTSATDVYGLGATLYYTLTGKAPFTVEDRIALRQ